MTHTPADTIEAVVFDKDGVLVDFTRTWTPVAIRAAHEFAAGDESRARAMLDKVGYDEETGSFRPGSVWAAGTNEDLINAWCPDCPPRQRLAMIERMGELCAATDPVPLVEPALMRRALEQLRAAGLKLALVSNDVTSSVENAVRAFGLDGLFDFMAGFDKVARPKPHADPLLAFAAHCAVRPAAMLVIGDNDHDAEMAHHAGSAAFIGVLSGNSGHAHMRRLTPHIAGDMLEASEMALRMADVSIDARLASL